AGFKNIDDFFDSAYRDNVLFELDLHLREKALKKFLSIPLSFGIYMFYNYDPRVLEMPDYQYGCTEKLLKKNSLPSTVICYELNEKNKFTVFKDFRVLMERFKKRGVKVAIDDFGAGFASFQLLYHSEPDILKVDRFLIQDIHRDQKKHIFCSHIVSLAKQLGITTIGEGVETEEEFKACKKIGFDLIQGYYIQRPVESVEQIKPIYTEILPWSKENDEIRENMVTDC
ncbi:MAG TPA: EAL domain-containing protein, partial [Bacillota bacterium]|nr:EAL domain-containing protein [Bacillota bacterium]